MGFVFSRPTAVTHPPILDQREEEDERWIERLKTGDVRAFDLLVKKYQKRIHSVIYHLTAHKEDTADLMQEVFLKVFHSIHSFKNESTFYTWVYRIALNTTMTFLKKRRRQDFSLESLDETKEEPGVLEALADRMHTDRELLRGELQESLNEALSKLSPKHRAAVVLFEIEGMSHLEVAKILGCSEGTVRSRLHYAKEQLKHLLSQYLDV
jgi:RNA polymerase sigma-70 factor (ECF subfamily)